MVIPVATTMLRDVVGDAHRLRAPYRQGLRAHGAGRREATTTVPPTESM